MDLVLISLMITSVQHLFMYLLAICMSSLEKSDLLSILNGIICLFVRLFCFLLLNFICSLCILDTTPYQIHDLCIFSMIQ